MATMWFLVDVLRDQLAPSQFENDVAVNEHQAVILHWNTRPFRQQSKLRRLPLVFQ